MRKRNWYSVRSFAGFWLVAFSAMSLLTCGKSNPEEPADRPRLTANVKMVDVHFHSTALNREMQYRAVLPANIAAGQKLPVVYLLHGGGGGHFQDWTNLSDVARYAERGLILVMPEAGESYYTNSYAHPQDRYEDYIVHDVIADVEHRFPVAAERSHRAIAGISMGGFGAVVLALKHPDLFIFAGGLSSAIDVTFRPFSMKRIGQWREYRSIFGPWGSPSRRASDPFVLAHSADSGNAPFIFLACGEQEGLLPANRRFASLLRERNFSYEFHTGAGGHDWDQWNRRLPDLFESLIKRFGN